MKKECPGDKRSVCQISAEWDSHAPHCVRSKQVPNNKKLRRIARSPFPPYSKWTFLLFNLKNAISLWISFSVYEVSYLHLIFFNTSIFFYQSGQHSWKAQRNCYSLPHSLSWREGGGSFQTIQRKYLSWFLIFCLVLNACLCRVFVFCSLDFLFRVEYLSHSVP